MINLSTLTNTHRRKRKIQRVGRGMGSKRGKTCGRGAKGDKARCGYRRNYGREGGRKPLYMKLPTRGFSNSRFETEIFAIDLGLINKHYKDGEVVSYETLLEKRLIPRRASGGIKVLSSGEIAKKKVSIEAHYFSKAALEKLTKNSIPYKLLGANKAAE